MVRSSSAKKPRFNQSLTLPLIDVVAALLIIVAAVIYWTHGRGEEEVAAATLRLEQARDENAAQLAATAGYLAEAETEHQQILELHDIRRAQREYIQDQIAQQQAAIDAARARDEPLIQETAELSAAISDLRERRAAQRRELRELELNVAESQAIVEALAAQADSRQDEVTRTHRMLQDPPPSRFPATSAVSLLASLGRDQNTYLVGLARSLTTVRGWDLGGQGSFGLAEDGDRTLLEVSCYANLLLPLRGMSLDLIGGVSHSSGPTSSEPTGTSGVWGGYLRLAPRSHERLHLLLGAVHSHDETRLRLGISFGRR